MTFPVLGKWLSQDSRRGVRVELDPALTSSVSFFVATAMMSDDSDSDSSAIAIYSYLAGPPRKSVFEALAGLDDALSSEAGKLLAAERTTKPEPEPAPTTLKVDPAPAINFTEPKSG